MRELKFRAWSTEEEKMYSFDIYTYMMYQEDAQEDLCPYHARANGLMQYTGLKDKNEVEIYEGDIVKDEYTTFEIYWTKGRFDFKRIFGAYQHPSFGYNCSRMEVIGNIHQNPNLIPT